MDLLFEDFVLAPHRRELNRNGAIVALEPQVFDLLVHLVRHRGRVVSKDELIDSVWAGRIVSDSTIESRVSLLRKSLGDDGQHQRLVAVLNLQRNAARGRLGPHAVEAGGDACILAHLGEAKVENLHLHGVAVIGVAFIVGASWGAGAVL